MNIYRIRLTGRAGTKLQHADLIIQADDKHEAEVAAKHMATSLEAWIQSLEEQVMRPQWRPVRF